MRKSAAVIRMRFYSVCANARTHKIAWRKLKKSKLTVAWLKLFKVKLIRYVDKTKNNDKYKFKACANQLRRLQIKSLICKQSKTDVNGVGSLTENNSKIITHYKMAVADEKQQENEVSGELQHKNRSYTSRKIKMADIHREKHSQYRVKASEV